jgi:hypothetical protein
MWCIKGQPEYTQETILHINTKSQMDAHWYETDPSKMLIH